MVIENMQGISSDFKLMMMFSEALEKEDMTKIIDDLKNDLN
jgi:hypothetical protein